MAVRRALPVLPRRAGHESKPWPLAHGEGAQTPDAAERRLKGSIGSSVQASLRDTKQVYRFAGGLQSPVRDD